MSRRIFAAKLAATGFSLILFTSAYGAVVETVKEDGRFSANFSSEIGPFEVDSTRLLQQFELHIQWWTLLGEPIEYYDFRWFAGDEYVIDGRTISRAALETYPNLLKRFDALRPVEVDLIVDGSFTDDSGGVQTIPDLLEPFYSSGDNFTRLANTDFRYLVEDRKLMITKSGTLGSGIVPGSPRDWEHFLQYRVFYDNLSSIALWHLVTDNGGLNGFGKLSAAQRDHRRQQLRAVFAMAEQLRLRVAVTRIEWREVEMRAIADAYDRYEAGEAEPSPKRIVERRMEDEVHELERFEPDDFWAEPEEMASALEVFETPHDRFGAQYGLRKKGADETVLDAKYQSITSGPGGYWVARHFNEFNYPFDLITPSGTVRFGKVQAVYFQSRNKCNVCVDDSCRFCRASDESLDWTGKILVRERTIEKYYSDRVEKSFDQTCYDQELAVESCY